MHIWQDQLISNEICIYLLALKSEFVFNIPPTAKVIWRQSNSLESHQTDWRSQGSNSGPLVQGEWLTHLCQMEFPTVINRTSPFPF